jgi:hypothetical protein
MAAFNSALPVSDHNKLGLPAHAPQKAGEARQIGFIQGGIDFVQYAEGDGFEANQGE